MNSNQVMTETAPRKDGASSEAWSRPLRAADRYLLAAGVSHAFVRRELIREAVKRLEVSDRSPDSHVREVRILACVERVLCERLGAEPGSETTHPDTARRRLLFAMDPTLEAQFALLDAPSVKLAEDSEAKNEIQRIPEIYSQKIMPRQAISYRRLPFQRFFARKSENRGGAA